MALTSPGVEITVVDESQYIPAATNSVPYVLIATAQNKVSGAGVGVAAGTLKANANKVYLITSQRDLSATYGVPFFYKTSAGTPINGYELNEYGLLAAYSALGVSNRCYVQRVDVDLAELTASLVRPTGNPDNGTYWLDTANSLWGIFEWNQTTSAFTNKVPTVITDSTLLESNDTIPLQSVGSIGDYAVSAAVTPTSTFLPNYYKRGGPTDAEAPEWDQGGLSASDLYNNWVLIGSDEWKTAWPTIQGTLAPTTLTAGNSIIINGDEVEVPVAPNNTVLGLAEQINLTLSGVYAASIGGKLFIYADSTASADDSTDNGIGIVEIDNGVGTPLASLGITATGSSFYYHAPVYQATPSYTVPRWRTTDTIPEPTGSVWQKTNNVNLGMNLVVKKYDSTLGTFVQQNCPVYSNDAEAIYALDPSGGGKNITSGSTYSQSVVKDDDTSQFQIFERYSTGSTVVTGSAEDPTFTNGNSFTISATAAGSNAFSTPVTVTITTGLGVDAAGFCAAVSSANVPYVSADVDSNGQIYFTHSQGGDILVRNTSGTPLATAGFTTSVRGVRTNYFNGSAYGLLLTNWVGTTTFTYEASTTAPDQDPADGRYWYYSATDQVDIMIQNNGSWCGYQTVSNDVRGDDLTATNVTGPIFSTTAPIEQTDGADLVPGDLWIDTSDLENYPIINRWTTVDGVNQWVTLDNSNQTTENGVLFADARWSSVASTNPITGNIPTIQSLLTSNYVDLDAPDPTLYPEGILLFNTRRSGFNVKSFQVDYFNTATFTVDSFSLTTAYAYNDFVLYNGLIYVCIAASTGNLPTNTTYFTQVEANAWVTASGNKADGSPNMGRQAQRAIIVAALKSGIDTSTEAREEQRQYNLIACPQYPELAPNMVALNNERSNTAFTVVDTPLRLTPDEVITWSTNNNGLGLPTADGLLVGSAYAGTFYPSCQTTDLSGSVVVQPPSHMMLRTIIRSDEVAYPWLAPAGTRRGVVDNASQIGYINSQTGEFISLGVRQGLRDVLYENRVNPITFVPGVGITNFGNKTVLDTGASALDRINVARLVAFIRSRLESIAKQFLFEPNDQITRNEITNAITSLMIDLVAKRGIYDYLVVCDLTNNTPARIDRNELYVDIAIEPVKAVEFIYIPVRIKNTGEIAAQSTI